MLPAGTGAGLDVTSVATIAADAIARGEFVVRRPGTVAGLAVAAYVVATVCAPAGPFEIEVLGRRRGRRSRSATSLIRVQGNTRALLTAERVALNLLTLMSGVATATRAWVDALAGTGTRVRDSRKTVPGLRMLQKYAVRVAGGVNHRMSLADAALIKDNHVIAAGGVVAAYRAVRRAFPDIGVQVEVTTAQAGARCGCGRRTRHPAGQHERRPRWPPSWPSWPTEPTFEASGGTHHRERGGGGANWGRFRGGRRDHPFGTNSRYRVGPCHLIGQKSGNV